MSEPKIQALEADAPIARRPQVYALRRTALYDAEGWNLMARAAPIRRDIVPWASPDTVATGVRGRGYGNRENECS
jgi:hypothetical protein